MAKKINWKKIEPYIIKNYNQITIVEMAKNAELNYQTLYKRISKMRREGKLPPPEPRKRKGASIKLKIDELDGNIELGRMYHIKKISTRDKFETNELKAN